MIIYDNINWTKGRYYTNQKYGYLHVYKYQKETGIQLMDNQVVHHIDENKHNNDITNLVMMWFWCHKKMHGKDQMKGVINNQTGIIYPSIGAGATAYGYKYQTGLSDHLHGHQETFAGFTWNFI